MNLFFDRKVTGQFYRCSFSILTIHVCTVLSTSDRLLCNPFETQSIIAKTKIPLNVEGREKLHLLAKQINLKILRSDLFLNQYSNEHNILMSLTEEHCLNLSYTEHGFNAN